MKKCEFCGKEFEDGYWIDNNIFVKDKKKYCSVDCRLKANMKRAKERKKNERKNN